MSFSPETYGALVGLIKETLAGAGALTGPPGPRGTDGREIELSVNSTHILWRYTGVAAWTDLVELSVLQGERGADGSDGSDGSNGETPEFRMSGDTLQIKYPSEADWSALYTFPPGGGGGFTPNANQTAAMNSGVTAQWKENVDTSIENLDADITSLDDAISANTQKINSVEDAVNAVPGLIHSHNTSNAAHADIREIADRAESIARGRSQGKVFATESAMRTWLTVPANVETLNIGDNLFIIDLDEPDFWWTGTEPQILGSEKVDLTEFYTKAEITALLLGKVDTLTFIAHNTDNARHLTNTAQTITGAKSFTDNITMVDNVDIKNVGELDAHEILVDRINAHPESTTDPIHILKNLSMQNNKITNLGTPTDPQDAATKQYVDANAGGSLPATTTANKALLSTTTSGTCTWSNDTLSMAGTGGVTIGSATKTGNISITGGNQTNGGRTLVLQGASSSASTVTLGGTGRTTGELIINGGNQSTGSRTLTLEGTASGTSTTTFGTTTRTTGSITIHGGSQTTGARTLSLAGLNTGTVTHTLGDATNYGNVTVRSAGTSSTTIVGVNGGTTTLTAGTMVNTGTTAQTIGGTVTVADPALATKAVRNIRAGTGAPPTLAVGEIYFRHN